MSESGQLSDWWFISKEPNGIQYLYNNELSLYSLNDTTEGALAQTLTQLWSDSSTLGYVIFNDEPVNQPVSFTCGHTKGIWAWNTEEQNGFILSHSIPIFPAGPSQTSDYQGLNSNAWTYAQNMICISISLDTLASLSQLAELTNANIYDYKIPLGTPDTLSNFANSVTIKTPICNYTHFNTSAGQSVIYFAKSGEWNNELYASCIAPMLSSNLFVESWIRGSAEGPSCNGTQMVNNIQELNLNSVFEYNEKNDHSKWVVTDDGSIFCSADINRMTTQYVRGGGAFCLQNSDLGKTMLGYIVSHDTC